MSTPRLTLNILKDLKVSPENPLLVKCDDGVYTSHYLNISIQEVMENKRIKIINSCGQVAYFHEWNLKHYPAPKIRPNDK